MFGKGTGVTLLVRSPENRLQAVSALANVNRQWKRAATSHKERSRVRPANCSRGEQRIIVVKPSAVSTGRLRRLLALHLRPIDLVVFQEPSDLAVTET